MSFFKFIGVVAGFVLKFVSAVVAVVTVVSLFAIFLGLASHVLNDALTIQAVAQEPKTEPTPTSKPELTPDPRTLPWYSKNKSNECEESKGPVYIIDLYQKVNGEYKTNDVVEKGVVVKTTIITPKDDETVYVYNFYRGLDRCQAEADAIKAKKAAELDRYR